MIFHLTTESTWKNARDIGKLSPPSLSSEGFIHFSTKEQLLESARIHFKDADQLLILEVNDEVISSEDLKWEKSRKEMLFPHLFRPLEVAEVSRTFYLERDPDGNWVSSGQ